VQVRGDLGAGVNDCARGEELAQPQDVIGVLSDIAAVDRFPARGAPRQIELELTRFRRHLIVRFGGVDHGEEDGPIHGGV